jgi:hypothetical protein
MTLPPKRPMPGKSFAPATSRVCAPAGVGIIWHDNASRRTSGVNSLCKSPLEIPVVVVIDAQGFRHNRPPSPAWNHALADCPKL